MKPNWITEYLQCHDYDYERNVRDYEIWRNNVNIIVIHPIRGIVLMYRIDMFDEHYNESTIEKDIKTWESDMGSQLKNTAGI